MEQNISNANYNKYVERVTPVHNKAKNALHAFIVGGIICTLGELLRQLFINYFNYSTDIASGYTSMILVLISVLLTAFNIYKPIAKWGGAGALVPITGFANSVASPTIEYQIEGEVYGKGVKIFTIAGPVILFGILTSWLLGLIYYLRLIIF